MYDQVAWWMGTLLIACASIAALFAVTMFAVEYVIRNTGHFMRVVHYAATRDAIRKAQRTGNEDDFAAAQQQFARLIGEARKRTRKGE